MELTAGTKLHGFTVTRIRENAEIGGRLVEMVFDKTATELAWVDNREENKLFCITFRTFPEDSTGVFHILEHSTLCGSEKFPVREPFVELLKSSMNTFLNAMTAGDKTMYPVSSRNEKDFLNLTEVYLDAVFAPRLLTDPNIFYQEGRRIEQEEEHLIFNGVVFNEMKGALSGADRVIDEKVASMLFRDNSYGFNSGGDPEHIPDLTYEQFKDTYRRFYHPSNSKIFLDGDIPLEKTLALLEAYLSRFERNTDLPEVREQIPAACEDTVCFEAAPSEPLENRGRITFAEICGHWKDGKTRAMALNVIADVLCSTNESPLKRAVLESGLAQDITLEVSTEDLQWYWQMQLVNVQDGREEEARKLVFDTLDALIEKGLDKTALLASINTYEFMTREEHEPKGLVHCMLALSANWLFDGDPMDGLVFDASCKELRVLLENGGFDALAKEVFCDRKALVTLRALPSRTVGDEKRAQEKARLAAIMASMTPEDLDTLRETNEKLALWQKTPDSPEALATLPTLTLADVDTTVRLCETTAGTAAGVRKLFNKVGGHGIKHLNLYFNLSRFTLEELSILSFANNIFGVLPTEKYTAFDLEQKLKSVFGSSSVSVIANAPKDNPSLCRPYFCVKTSFLDDNRDEVLPLLEEVLLHTKLDCKERIRETVLQHEEMNKQAGAYKGYLIAMLAAQSHYYSASTVADAVSGYTAIRYLHRLASDFENEYPKFIQVYERVVREAFCRAGMIVSVGGTEDMPVEPLVTAFPEGTCDDTPVRYTNDLPDRLGIRVPVQVNFAVQAWDIAKAGIRYDGSMSVADNMLSLSFLWNRVRVQGGAYGVSLSAAESGSVFAYSYRDPTPANTLKVYAETGAQLRAYAESGEKPDNFIISTIAAASPLQAPRYAMIEADARYLTGSTVQDKERTLREMLAADKAHFLVYADALDAFAKNGAVCVVGPDNALKECPDLEILDL